MKVKCLIFRFFFSLTFSLSDGKYYETVKANFERADRNTVVRTVTNSRVTNCYLLSCYQDLLFN